MIGPSDDALRWLADLAVRGGYVSCEELLQREILNEESVPYVLGVEPPTKWIEMCDENGTTHQIMGAREFIGRLVVSAAAMKQMLPGLEKEALRDSGELH